MWQVYTRPTSASDFFYPFGTIGAQQWPSKSRLQNHSTNEANRTFVAAKPTRLKNGKYGRKMKNIS
jgi:hypothetical protein